MPLHRSAREGILSLFSCSVLLAPIAILVLVPGPDDGGARIRVIAIHRGREGQVLTIDRGIIIPPAQAATVDAPTAP